MAPKPTLGTEYPQPNEARDTQEIIDTIINHLKRVYAPGKTKRQFHAKAHGLVEATFTVNADLPQHLQYGILQPGKSYKAWIRFSNGNTKVVDDRKADLRGMAIKLLDVPGEMLIQDERMPQSQDFLLVSYPTLMAPNVAAFKKSIKAVCGGMAGMALFALNPGNWPVLIRTLQSMKKTNSLLSLQFWSVSPSRLGTKDQAVKYSVIPVTPPVNSRTDKSDKNFLRADLQQTLDNQDFSFHFMIQMQEDAVRMPIEDPCVAWDSPFQKVAVITIPKQDFANESRDSFGENLTFSPWHCLTTHQPLGGIARARKLAYHAISLFRLKQNNVT
ncbi:catalase family protein [Taibaiella soli]|uniref:Catalase n=1 Tax=Taibaiella soli TaxID=1649169 RepID=A0A2W2B292_9BACT|nr:catalase family protein [Taibaiella soli]PZF74384.1 hypothetical protein DN068_02050 [Taibaiella soli]